MVTSSRATDALQRGAAVIPGHISALDGQRAFAILAVMFHHYGEYYLLLRRILLVADTFDEFQAESSDCRRR